MGRHPGVRQARKRAFRRRSQKNIKIKIQFQLGEEYIVMFGVVRAVEYNQNSNQSRLHFECVTLPQKMKNEILTYVYNVIPQEEKDAFEAMTQAESDISSETEQITEQTSTNIETTNPIQSVESSKDGEDSLQTQSFEAFLKEESLGQENLENK